MPPPDLADLDPDPIRQFAAWYEAALGAGLREPTAMTLATASREGAPSARIVLLKGFDERGFLFYTNYESRKARELDENPLAALVFFWPELERQVRVEGTVERLSEVESAVYFATRPRGSQLGAWASPQSNVIADRAELETRLAELEERFRGSDVPLPPHWGGFRLTATALELWAGRPDRLHDRFRYRRARESWILERVAP